MANTTEVAIHTNPFTDLYAPIGTSSSRTGGWYTTIMKLPFIFFIRIGFMLASLGLLYDDGRPPVGGLLHKAPVEEKLYPNEYKMLSSAQHRD